MTHNKTGLQVGSIINQASLAHLADAIREHNNSEKASFHTPGHKGVASFAGAQSAWKLDITELPGFDELSHPTGLLRNLEDRAAKLWGAEQSVLSLNGASAAVIAAICACASRAGLALIPTNCHRSVVNALIISGLAPIWYEPQDDLWTSIPSAGAVRTQEFSQLLAQHGKNLACAVVVSPTYTGIFSDISSLSESCRKQQVPLIVDEAHGAHLIAGSVMPPSAVSCGADLVIHSLHKTVPALTQTGVLHRMSSCPVGAETLRACMNLIHSSSPSYLLLASVEAALGQLENSEYVNRIALRSAQLLTSLPPEFESFCDDPAHILLRLPDVPAETLFASCCSRGIYPEAVLGNAVLFLLGTNSTDEDISNLQLELTRVVADQALQRRGDEPGSVRAIVPDVTLPSLGALPGEHLLNPLNNQNRPMPGRRLLEQVLTPREAFFAPTEVVLFEHAGDRIAADCLAPCPPGTPVAVPGQRLTGGNLPNGMPSEIRVVIESQPRGEQ